MGNETTAYADRVQDRRPDEVEGYLVNERTCACQCVLIYGRVPLFDLVGHGFEASDSNTHLMDETPLRPNIVVIM